MARRRDGDAQGERLLEAAARESVAESLPAQCRDQGQPAPEWGKVWVYLLCWAALHRGPARVLQFGV